MHEWYRYGINHKNHWRDNSKNKAQATAKKEKKRKKKASVHNNPQQQQYSGFRTRLTMTMA